MVHDATCAEHGGQTKLTTGSICSSRATATALPFLPATAGADLIATNARDARDRHAVMCLTPLHGDAGCHRLSSNLIAYIHQLRDETFSMIAGFEQ